MQVVEHIGSFVFSEAIEHHSFDQLATIFNQCQDDLRTLTVSHDKIEMFLRLGEEWLSCGKLTGGGRGGSMLILAKELQAAKNIVAQLKKMVHNIHGLRS